MRKLHEGGRSRRENAAALIEYVLLLAFIALAAVVGMQTLGYSANNKTESVAQAIEKGKSGNPNDGKDGNNDGNAGGGNNKPHTVGLAGVPPGRK